MKNFFYKKTLIFSIFSYISKMKQDFALIFFKMYYSNMLLPKTIINFVIVLY